MSINYTHIHLNKITLFSAMLVTSILLSYAESLVPFQVYGIGFKIGLANIATIVAMFTLSYTCALLIGILRVAFLSYFFSNLIYFQLSISGFLISFIVMAILFSFYRLDIRHNDKRLDIKIILVSIAGSISHNIAQIVVCYFILGNQLIVFKTLYVLIPIAIVTGTIVGYLSTRVLKLIKYSK